MGGIGGMFGIYGLLPEPLHEGAERGGVRGDLRQPLQQRMIPALFEYICVYKGMIGG